MHKLRGQYAFRPATGPDQITVLIGLLEAPAGVLPLEHILTFSGFGAAAAYQGRVSAEPTRPRDPWGNFAQRSVGDMLTANIWNRSSGMSDVVQIYTRRAAAVADAENHDLILFAGMLQSNCPSDEITGFGNLSWDMITGQIMLNEMPCRQPDELARWTGCSHGQILNKPIWGWSDEPWALRATMEEGFIADCDRLRQLVLRNRGLGAPLTPAEDRERQALEQTEARHVTGEKQFASEPLFFSYMREKLHRHGPESIRVGGRDPLSRLRAEEREAGEIMASILIEN